MTLDELSDLELSELSEALTAELRRRALDRFDPATLADVAFGDAFDSKGWPRDPWIAGGLLICCGTLKGKPGGHRCSFTVVDEQWAWQGSYEHDELRWLDDQQLRVVSVLIALPGRVVTQVECKCDGGVHKRTSTTSWKITAGRLEPTATPSRVPQEHRR